MNSNDYKEVAISAQNNESFLLEQAMTEHDSSLSKPLETTATHVNIPALVLNIPSLTVNVSATSTLPSQEKDAISPCQIEEVSEVPSPKYSDDVRDNAVKPCKKENKEKLAIEMNSSPQKSSFDIPIAKEHIKTTTIDSKEVQAQEKVYDPKEVHMTDSEDEDSKVSEYNKLNQHIICEPTLPDAYEKLHKRSDSYEHMDVSGTTSHPYERINMSLLDAPSDPYETIKRDDSYEDMSVSSFQYERVDF